MKIKISAQTNVGLERTNNEDAYIYCSNINEQNWEYSPKKYSYIGNLGSIAVVADGMGGKNAGETASNIAIRTIKDCFKQKNFTAILSSNDKIHSFIKETFQKADNAIMEYIKNAPETIGMGTTIVLLWLINEKAYIAWCGDSRCYVFNPTYGLKALSKDHSYVQDLIDKGDITSEESYNHPDNNIITRCLGDSDTSADPDIITYDVNDNDIFLLCSDGLCGYCRDSEIEKVINKNYIRINKCTKSLIKMALNTGGHDNITVLLLSTKNVHSINNKEDSSIRNKIKRIINMFSR